MKLITSKDIKRIGDEIFPNKGFLSFSLLLSINNFGRRFDII